MRLFKRYLILALILIGLTTCKKKTSITVRVLNPGLNVYVPNAKVVLLRNHANLLGKRACEEIATATTDENGIAYFDREKLYNNQRNDYLLAVKESWGVEKSYPCEPTQANELKVGGAQEKIITDYGDALVIVQCNNAFNPGISGDSLIAKVDQAVYYDPAAGHTQGGGGIGGVYINYDSNFPYPSQVNSPSIKIFANRLIVSVRKRKMGVVSTSLDTVRAYPNQTTTVQINW